jgi:phosphotriesterase-related protein
VAGQIVRDIDSGVGDTGIRAGMIGEVGTEWPLREADRISLRAAAHAQRETGASLSIHPGRSPEAPFEILDLLSAEGVDLARVVMGHVDRTLFEHDLRVELARRGCFLSFDQFSIEGWSPFRMVRSEAGGEPMAMPTDAERVDQITALVEAGFLGQLLLSHDHCHKHRLRHYGGPGYGHILRNVVPLLRACGLDEQEVSAMLVDNPQRLLRFD